MHECVHAADVESLVRTVDRFIGDS